MHLHEQSLALVALVVSAVAELVALEAVVVPCVSGSP
jgi:hypothetical protein